MAKKIFWCWIQTLNFLNIYSLKVKNKID
jgi:hypothetical protein